MRDCGAGGEDGGYAPSVFGRCRARFFFFVDQWTIGCVLQRLGLYTHNLNCNRTCTAHAGLSPGVCGSLPNLSGRLLGCCPINPRVNFVLKYLMPCGGLRYSWYNFCERC